MNDEIELLKYLLTNLRIQQEVLYKILKKKEVKDEVYEVIRYEIAEYKKYIISVKRMLCTRLKKFNKDINVFLGVASSIGANITKINNNLECLDFLKESAKVNIMDLQRVRKEYNITSKTVIKLLDRLNEFEQKNIEKVVECIK